MKKIFCIIVCITLVGNVFAYTFSAVAPSGQTLYYYYNHSTGEVSVTYPTNSAGYFYDGYTMPTGNLSIPSTVSYEGHTFPVVGIGNDAFHGCSGLTSVTIPNSVTSIGNHVFSGCSGLTSVSIPNSMTSIGNNAFYHCIGLTSVIIPNSVTSIGSYAFSLVRHIEYHGSATGSPWGAISMNGVVDGDFVFSDSTKHYMLAYLGAGGDVTIPSTVDTIGDFAFYVCSGLTSVTIPNSVTSIGNLAFYDCSGLTSVIIGNSVASIGNSAFYGCSGLTSVTIGNSVASIGDFAFHGCSGLTSVIIPNSVTSIGNSAFHGCSGLTSVTIGNSVTSISNAAFYGCSGLTSVAIPNSVTSIDRSAFHGCSGLTSVTIGDSVTSIGNQAFSGCSGLTEIHSEASVAPLLGTDCFAYVPNNIPVYIPCGSQMSYYSRWSYFSNFVEAAGFTFSATPADETMGSVTVLTQPTCQSPTAVINATPAAGYLFLQWDNGVTDNPYSLVVTSDTALSAIFVSANEGIDGVDAMNAKVYTSQRQIVVKGADGNMVTLYDVNGRVLATKQDNYSLLRFDTPTSGTYMIKVGTLPARKVVVTR